MRRRRRSKRRTARRHTHASEVIATDTYRIRMNMHQKLIITVDADVYDGLHSAIGRRLDAGYAAMTADEAHEQEAEAWAEALIGDVADKPHGT